MYKMYNFINNRYIINIDEGYVSMDDDDGYETD